jgi:hypothetical protein
MSTTFGIKRTRQVAGVIALAAGVAHIGWALADATGAATSTEAAAASVSTEATETTGKPTPTKMSLEQLRARMADAEKRRQEALKPDRAIDNKLLAEKWGVEVNGISRTAGGYMLDFRFRVVDAKKALPLFDHRTKPYVVAQKSDIKLPVPVASKVGAFRPTNRGKNIKADKSYYMIFANPDNYAKPGDRVSVIIGDFRVENLTVND